MNTCSKCLENNWTLKYNDGMITATCNLCDNVVEFEATRKKNNFKLKIGSPCRKCKTPIIYKKSRYNEKKLLKKYYYTGFFKCPRCRTVYYSDEFKIIN